MTNNGYVKWTTFVFVAMLFITILGVVWNTLTKVQEDVSSIKSDVAVIKNQLNIRQTTSLLDRMKNNE